MKKLLKHYLLLALPAIVCLATRAGEIDWWKMGL